VKMADHSLTHLLAGIIRVSLRTLWSPIYITVLRLRVAIWGSNAFEHAVAFTPPWLTLAILKAYGVEIGTKFDFHGRLSLHGTYNMNGKLHIGNQCHIGPGVTLDLSAPIVLEDRCTIALNATILTHHDVGYSPLRNHVYPTRFAGVTIEYGAFIGAGAMILAGVRIGKCSVIGSGSVVVADVPSYTVVAGIPAYQIKQLDATELDLQD
jgi:acetyltransferase-like isoleucine patch superfamily enzyme